MRLSLLAGAVAFLPGALFAHCCDIRWPDADISLPPEVQSFILAECHALRVSSEEDFASCANGEAYGYRAVVDMLKDDRFGERAAELYRACRAGLGAEGGRFHRRRAECIGISMGITWRFEFTRKASIDRSLMATDFAASAVVPMRPRR